MSRPSVSRPLVGISACRRQIKAWTLHTVGDRYVKVVLEAVTATPILLPAVGVGEQGLDLDRILDAVDGVLLTGSPSNVEPFNYGGRDPRPGVAADPARDSTTLPVIRGVVERGIPLLAICRGIQEVQRCAGRHAACACRGDSGRMDHRSPRVDSMEAKVAPAHAIDITEGGLLKRITGLRHAEVNSLHGQGIDKPAPGARIEAVAPDGQIEAISMPGAPGFMLAVQWHPEHRALENPLSRAIFHAFGEACRARMVERHGLPLRAAAE